MREDNEAFEQLGCDVRTGGPLRPPFDEPTTASDVAVAIQAALVEMGLSLKAIRKIGCALLSVSRGVERSSDARTGRPHQ